MNHSFKNTKPIIHIESVSINATIDLGFGQIHGLRELQQLVEKRVYVRSCKEVDVCKQKLTSNTLHVGEVWDSYPVFDIYDLSDNRSYQNYIIRPTPITDKELKMLARVRPISNECRVYESMPANLLPVVYYKGDGNVMLVATLQD